MNASIIDLNAGNAARVTRVAEVITRATALALFASVTAGFALLAAGLFGV